MCTEVEWFRFDNNRCSFEFEFQCNPDGWQPKAVYVGWDQRIPVGLATAFGQHGTWVDENGTTQPCAPGILEVPYHKEINFNLLFNAYFEGFQQIL
jgi:hypothetical protein